MATPRHPVSVRASALVQTARFQTFAFSVRWSDNSNTFVRRSWDEFRGFHRTLKESFPVEAGLLRRSGRVLPRLPDALLLLCRGRVGRGLERLRLLEDYLRALLTLVARASRSPVLTDFLEPHALDLEPALPPGSLVILPAPEEPPAHPAGSPSIRGLEPQSLRCLQPFHTRDTRGRPFHAQAQEALDVLLRHPSGWWLVENEGQQTAWFPAPYLEEAGPRPEAWPPRGSGIRLTLLLTPTTGHCVALRGYRNHLSCRSQFCASRAYESSNADELSVPVGARVDVLETSDRGWWLCRFGARTGLLPALLLRPDWLGAVLGISGLHLRADGSASEARRSLESTQATTLTPAVPARPMLSVIQSRCCTITRRALGRDPGGQGPP